MKRETRVVTAVDACALLLYLAVLTQVPSPPFGLSSKAMMVCGLMFPVVAYVWVWRHHPESFWYGFVLSLAGVTVLAVLGLGAILAFPGILL